MQDINGIKVSVIIPVLNEAAYIRSNIVGMLETKFPMDQIEFIYVDGMSNDGTRDIIQEYVERYPCIRMLDNPEKITPVALNIGHKNAYGTYSISCGAHSKMAPEYIGLLVEAIENLHAEAVGGKIVTEVYHRNKKSIAIQKVLTNRFGVGNTPYRVEDAEQSIREVDTAGFLCYNRKYLLSIGGYDENLIRNQDIELNKRIKINGGRIYLVPKARVTYFARETYSELAKNNYGNGKWNLLTLFYTNDFRSLSIRHFIPLLFLLSLVVPTILSIVDLKFLIVSGLSFIAYNMLIISQCIRSCDPNTTIWSLLKAFYTLHFSYGWGSFIGIFKVFKLKLFGDKNESH
ncbi:glycosyltransferase family 2 protein [Bacilliculturomica massiliensis]|uniref:glycosyltransferase family 2 protein n=1 Tax=Bacilliculturomica massiliensis TaxID=1917867 RepID=UPI00103082AA|nr:glycosyltransferase family 2 protein [Bacilliculturomica massiliensis]